MITSRQNETIKELKRILDTQHKTEEPYFIVEGTHLVEEAVLAGRLIKAYSTEEVPYEHELISMSVLEKLTKSRSPQGIIGLCEKEQRTHESKRALVLEVNDPGNLGTLIRSAVAFGFDTIFSISGSVSFYNDKVIRASQGAIFQINLLSGSSIDALNKFSDLEWFAADLDGTNPKPALGDFVLVLGHETKGVLKELKNNATVLTIPTLKVDSLNVAVAGSILMNELVK